MSEYTAVNDMREAAQGGLITQEQLLGFEAAHEAFVATNDFDTYFAALVSLDLADADEAFQVVPV